MYWYSQGSIEVVAGGVVAAGTGTAFLENVRLGDGLVIEGSAAMHEITGIASDLQLSFAPPYAGAGGAGKTFRVVPVQGYVKEAADRLLQVLQKVGPLALGEALQALATAADDGQRRAVLGLGNVDNTADIDKPLSRAASQAMEKKADKSALGNASVRTVTEGPNDQTAGRLLKVGDFGLGGVAPPFGGNLNKLSHGQTVYGNPATNGPTGAFYGWVRHTEVTPGEYSFQEAFDVTGKMWTRALNVRVWSDWDQVLTTRRLDPSTVVKGYGRGSGYVPGPGAVFPELTQDPANNVLPYISALEIRETGRLVNSAGPAEWVRPALTFHFGGYTVKRLSMDHNGQLWLGSDRLALVNADFERGANANGEYIKYPDGTLIVWGQRTVTPSSANAVSEHFFATAAAFNLNFPVACTCSGFNPELTNSYQILHHRIVATGQAQIRLQFNSSYVQPYGVAFIAIGRWK